ncbi:hypothetical protein PVBG_03673 [Plasmodium vivax Brazil I]|uniref:Uncharacterized protein n=1 Tax=Plasmodium vivax (strain Brazil I) TaxID=1033975 RepID=A0A0J9VPY6_PLAV1|nr:hypothetical protein PVBG_03673 [Plasmodium vivax Brazil I]
MEENVVNEAYALFKGEILVNSSLHKFYERINNHIHNLDKNCAICKDKNKDDEFLKLCCSLEKIIEKWNSICLVKENEKCTCCDYLLYWLHRKIVEENLRFHNIYMIYDKLETLMQRICTEKDKKCSVDRVYDINALKKKKKLLDFLLNYDRIKSKLQETSNVKKRKYCNYVYYIFELYKQIESSDTTVIYEHEKDLFKNKFKADNKTELSFLNTECPNKCLDLVFNEKNKRFCYAKMQTKVDDYAHKLFKLRKPLNYNSLKELPSSKIYEELNKDENGTTYDKYCKDKFNSNQQNKDLNNLCKKIARNVKTKLSSIKEKEKNSYDRCLYFNYWTYEEIRKIYKSNDKYIYNIPIFTIILNVLKKIYNEITNDEVGIKSKALNDQILEIIKQSKAKKEENAELKINPLIKNFKLTEDEPCLYNVVCGLGECKEMKDLFDYFKNYDYIINCNISTDRRKYQKYCEYVTYINELYDDYIGECCTYFMNSAHVDRCPKFFKCDEKYNPYNLYSKLGCKDEKKDDDFKIVHNPGPIDYEVILKSAKSFSSTSNHLLNDTFFIITSAIWGVIGILFLYFLYYKVITEYKKNSEYVIILSKILFNMYLKFLN